MLNNLNNACTYGQWEDTIKGSIAKKKSLLSGCVPNAERVEKLYRLEG